MKKHIALLTIPIIIAVFASCNADTSEIDRLKQENQSLIERNSELDEQVRLLTEKAKTTDQETQTLAERSGELEKELRLLTEKSEETVDAIVTGSFTATVRDIIVDYYAEPQPRIAILTEFQSGPFLLPLDKETLSQIEVGGTYCFTIHDMYVGEIPLSTFQIGYRGPFSLGNYPHIESVHAATSYETGMLAPWLRYEKAD